MTELCVQWHPFLTLSSLLWWGVLEGNPHVTAWAPLLLNPHTHWLEVLAKLWIISWVNLTFCLTYLCVVSNTEIQYRYAELQCKLLESSSVFWWAGPYAYIFSLVEWDTIATGGSVNYNQLLGYLLECLLTKVKTTNCNSIRTKRYSTGNVDAESG